MRKVLSFLTMAMMMGGAMSQAHTVSEILQAKYSGNNDRVEQLLKAGVTLNLFEAAATGQTDRVGELIAGDPASVNAYAPDGFFPLALAVFFGNTATVDALLKAGADVNQQSREAMKISSLHSAAAVRRLDLAEMLIAHGANPSSSSAAPAFTASRSGCGSCARWSTR